MHLVGNFALLLRGKVPWALGLEGCPKSLIFMILKKLFVYRFFMPDLERKNGITGVPFGRTELSIGASGRKFSALESREGPMDPGIEGMPEKFDFHDFCLHCCLKTNMKMVDEYGWILEFRAENDAK